MRYRYNGWTRYSGRLPDIPERDRMEARLLQHAKRLGKYVTVRDKSHCTLRALLDIATPDVIEEMEAVLREVQKLADRADVLAARIEKGIVYANSKKPLHRQVAEPLVLKSV